MVLDKGTHKRVSKYFYSDDLDCKCKFSTCTTTLIDPLLLEAIDELWEIAGEFKINSGYRCKKHNLAVGGEKDSQHLLGKAVDIESSRGFSGPELAKYVLQVELFEHGGLGVAEHWLHGDVRSVRARWTYPIATH